MEDFIDNRNEDPDFEPQRKKHKKNTDIISNDLMLYVITKFGKDFFTETDKVERKQMCEMIRDDLITEKSVVIEQDLIYENLMTQKKTFLREKKKTGKTQNAKWPFFEAFLSLGSCIRSESSSTSDKKHSKDSKSKDSKDSKSKSSRKSSSRKDSRKRSKDDSANDSQSGVGLTNLFGASFSESEATQSENDAKKEVLNTSNGPSTSNSFNASQSTPKSDKDNKTAPRSKGFLFDKSIGVQDKLGYFFGKYENEVDDNVATQAPVSTSKQPEFHSEAEMLAYLDTLIPKSPTKDEAAPDVPVDTQDDPVNTQIDPMDYINSSLPASEEEEYASQYPATQDSQEVEGDISCTDDSSNIDSANNNKERNDKNGPEIMITDEDDTSPIDGKMLKAIKNIMNEVLANKVFDKIDDSGADSEGIKELRELFNENESRIGAMLELEEKVFKLQRDIIKSELKFKAKLVQILENMDKKK